MIECKICNEKFKIITNSHVKTHGITLAEYIEKYGETLSDESRNKIREKRKGQIITPESIQKGTQSRKEYYEKHESPLKGKKLSDDHRKKSEIWLVSARKTKTENSHQKIQQRLNECNLVALNSFKNTSLQLQCNICKNEFVYTKQYFQNDKKYKKKNKKFCDVCYPRHDTKTSGGEEEINSYIASLDITTISSCRNLIWPYEIDIFLPDHNVGIEYCGLYWHSELGGSGKSRHLNKREMAAEKDIIILTVFEDEWHNQKDIVMSNICNITGKHKKEIESNNIMPVNRNILNEFLVENHISGIGKYTVGYGIYHENEIVSVMSFNNSEINRYADKNFCNVHNSFQKLLNYHISSHNNRITGFIDKRWHGNENHFTENGFNEISHSVPYYWHIESNRLRRYRKPQSQNKHSSIIWDCGYVNYELTC